MAITIVLFSCLPEVRLVSKDKDVSLALVRLAELLESLPELLGGQGGHALAVVHSTTGHLKVVHTDSRDGVAFRLFVKQRPRNGT